MSNSQTQYGGGERTPLLGDEESGRDNSKVSSEPSLTPTLYIADTTIEIRA